MKHEDYYMNGHRGNRLNFVFQNSILHAIGSILLFLSVCLNNSLTGAYCACGFIANQKYCGCFMPVSDDFSKILRVQSVRNESFPALLPALFHALLPALFQPLFQPLFQYASEMKVSRPANGGQRRNDCGGKKNNHTVENMFAAACRAILLASPSFCLKMNDKKPANFAYFPIPS
jgi:hypothetical protein